MEVHIWVVVEDQILTKNCGKSKVKFHPNLGRYSLFADPCAKQQDVSIGFPYTAKTESVTTNTSNSFNN